MSCSNGSVTSLRRSLPTPKSIHSCWWTHLTPGRREARNKTDFSGNFITCRNYFIGQYWIHYHRHFLCFFVVVFFAWKQTFIRQKRRSPYQIIDKPGISDFDRLRNSLVYRTNWPRSVSCISVFTSQSVIAHMSVHYPRWRIGAAKKKGKKPDNSFWSEENRFAALADSAKCLHFLSVMTKKTEFVGKVWISEPNNSITAHWCWWSHLCVRNHIY